MGGGGAVRGALIVVAMFAVLIGLVLSLLWFV